ncbi:MAG: IPTL-CTERM sorting domain-containing protein [Comamonadaceae bacterium]|nr:MAG: IPTL-CTERM sorting domain-containing protein [Comamonadaceae bacterium]
MRRAQGGQFVLAYGNTTQVPTADLDFRVWAVAPGDPTSAVSIPTLSQWGLIVMSALLGLLSLARMRRRSQP